MKKKQTDFAYVKTKTQISFAVTAKLIIGFVFATWIVQFLFFLNPKFQASILFLRLYQAGLCRIWPEDRFSRFTAQICYDYIAIIERHTNLQDNTILLYTLACFCACTARFVLDLFGNHIVGFPKRRLICKCKIKCTVLIHSLQSYQPAGQHRCFHHMGSTNTLLSNYEISNFIYLRVQTSDIQQT